MEWNRILGFTGLESGVKLAEPNSPYPGILEKPRNKLPVNKKYIYIYIYVSIYTCIQIDR